METKTLKLIGPITDRFVVPSRPGLLTIRQAYHYEILNAIGNIERHIEDMKAVTMIPQTTMPKEYKGKGIYTIIYDNGQAYGLHQNGNEYELSVNIYTIT